MCVEELSTILWIWQPSLCSNSMCGREFRLASSSFSKLKIQGLLSWKWNWGFQIWLSALLFPTLLSSPLLSVCFSWWCVHSAPYSLENLPIDTKLRFNESFLQHGFVQVLWLVLWLCRCLTMCPANLWISCFVFPLSLLRSSVSGPGRGRFRSPGLADSPTLEVSLHSHVCRGTCWLMAGSHRAPALQHWLVPSASSAC